MGTQYCRDGPTSVVDYIPQSVYDRAKEFGWRTHIPLLERNMPFRRDLINECPKPDGGELPANVHNWVLPATERSMTALFSVSGFLTGAAFQFSVGLSVSGTHPHSGRRRINQDR